jgi:hypothetical protein
MEPSGRNRSQPSQTRLPRKRRKPPYPQPLATHGNLPSFDGKEGVRRFESVRGLCKRPRKAGPFLAGSIPFASLQFLRVRAEMSLPTRS